MSDNDLPLGLARKDTYASLSPADLEQMGRQASNLYLADGLSLNDAVIKIASEHPSISTHQIKRIVEFANTETFQRVFEKQANDKNIEFPLADPGVVLRSMNVAAQGHTMSPTPSDYMSEPVKMAHQDIEADIQLCRAFGFDVASPGVEKTAAMPAPIMGMARAAKRGAGAFVKNLNTPVSKAFPNIGKATQTGYTSGIRSARSAATRAKNVEMVAATKAKQQAAKASRKAGAGTATGATRAPKSGGWMLPTAVGLGGVGVGLAGGAALANSRQPQAQGMTVTASVNPIQDFLKTAAPMMAGPMIPEEQGQDGQFHEQLLDMERAIELEKKKQELATIQQKTFEMMNPQPEIPQDAGAQQGMGQEQGMPAQGQEQMMGDPSQMQEQAPPDYAYGPQMKTGASRQLMDEAIGLSKTASIHATAVQQDLIKASSVDLIKQAAAARPQYPEANPFGELFRARQKLAAITEDALHAVDKNEMMLKDAEANWVHQIKQHLLSGGSLGDVAQVMEYIDERPEHVKVAMDLLKPLLDNPRFNAAQLQAMTIKYEMEKGASHRIVNTNNPIAAAYGTMVKLADGQETLKAAYADLQSALNAVEAEVQKVMKTC